jgi:acetoin utilization protein AcuB
MHVRDILDVKVAIASPHESASAAWERLQALGTDHVVVVKDGRVVGVVSRQDLSGPSGGAHRRMGRRVGDLMRDAVTATPSTSVARAVALMRRPGVTCLPVIERGKLAGIVTVPRLLRLLERMLRA